VLSPQTLDGGTTYTRRGPVTGSTTTSFIEALLPADIYEPAYGGGPWGTVTCSRPNQKVMEARICYM